jgi:very-short-patch-repair endonuclease
MNQNHYNKYLRQFAKENKQSMTKAEACLGKYALSKKQMLGYAFRRQRPVLNYIVDFICLRLKLVIEIDGYSHQLRENEVKDQIRQEAIEEVGFTVLRFKDEEVLNSMNQVRTAIQRQIEVLVDGA